MESMMKPAAVSFELYSSTVGKYHGLSLEASIPRARNAFSIAFRMFKMLPCPPHSATNLPCGFNTRFTPEMTASGSLIQCNAAFEKTASNCCSRRMFIPSMTWASKPRLRAPATCSALASMPTTRQPRSASFCVNAPSPQPRSKMVSCVLGFRRSRTGVPRSATNAAFFWYEFGSQVCDIGMASGGDDADLTIEVLHAFFFVVDPT
mmetsp:Transcript_4930/g.9442  ORF Transcript_4930/g.9442 Transcript_4930/m.9442 type:complete len:206 (+) Transcript_4930:269-886(+)